jgi:hypothetical protein
LPAGLATCPVYHSLLQVCVLTITKCPTPETQYPAVLPYSSSASEVRISVYKFLFLCANAVLQNGENQLDGSCEKLSIYVVKEERNIKQTVKIRKDNWIGHILHRHCLLEHVAEGKIEGRI